MTVIASVLMLSGAVLTLIAAIGVFRFPDALSRLHAATKAASIGIALVLVGAGASLGAAPLAFTTLVAVFQVATAPVAAHALGRAARPEPEPGPEPPRAAVPPIARVAALAVLWVALWGEISAANLAGGLAVGIAVTGFISGRSEERTRVRPLASLRFAATFSVLLIRSTIAVAIAALGPRHLVDTAIREVALRPGSTAALIATANAVSLTPGTLTLAVDAEKPALLIHLLQADDDVVDAIPALHELAARALPAAPRQARTTPWRSAS